MKVRHNPILKRCGVLSLLAPRVARRTADREDAWASFCKDSF
jgi:hypothetical protein